MINTKAFVTAVIIGATEIVAEGQKKKFLEIIPGRHFTASSQNKKTTGCVTRNKKDADGSVAIGRVSYIGQYTGDNPEVPSSFRLEVGRETDNLTTQKKKKKVCVEKTSKMSQMGLERKPLLIDGRVQKGVWRLTR